MARSVQTSIVVPVKNEEEYIPRLINAIRNQNLSLNSDQLALELVFIDSGSTDATPEIIERYRRELEWIRLYRVSRFHHSIIRNKGAELAKGEIIVFLNADAIPANREWLVNLVNPILKDDSVAASFSRQMPPLKPHFEVVRLLQNYPSRGHIIDKNNFREILAFYGVLLTTVSCAVRRDLFFKVGGFSKNIPINEDQDLALKLLREGYRIVYANNSVVIHAHMDPAHKLFRRYYYFGYGWKKLRGMYPELFGGTSSPFSGGFSRRIFHMFRLMLGLSNGIRSTFNMFWEFIVSSIGFVLGQYT